MTEKTKNILSLVHTEAMDFFLKSEQYHGFELPEYFVFDDLLQNVKNAVGKTPYEECLQEGMSPELLPDVNLYILIRMVAILFVLLFLQIHSFIISLSGKFAMNSHGLS